jgi:hypothetical protein
MPASKGEVVSRTMLFAVAVGAGGSISFLLVAVSSGFDIPVALFALPLAAAFIIIYLPSLEHLRLPPALRLEQGVLAVSIVGSAILRIILASTASYYPDEYGTWAILKANPWSNIGDFLARYNVFTGTEVVHPPLGFLLMALGYSFNRTVVGARFVSVVIALASILVVYWLACALSDKTIASLVAAIFAFMPQTVIFLSLALTDAYVFFFGLLGLTIFIHSLKHRSRAYALISGIFLGAAYWSKAAIPLAWTFVIMLAALFFTSARRQERILAACLCYLIAASIYGLLAVVSPISFWASINVSLSILGHPIVLGSLPTTLLPQIWNASGSTISFYELLMQIPAWVTPLVTVFALLELWMLVKTRKGEEAWLGLWAVMPLLGMLPYYRDIRYLLISSFPVSILALKGTSLSKLTQRRILATMLVFLVVGCVSFIPVLQQQYAGIPEASDILAQLGLSREVILTNALSLGFYLPNATLLYLSPNADLANVQAMLQSRSVVAVVIIHQLRGAWATPSPVVMSFLRAHFLGHITGGPSKFSWWEILYSGANTGPTSKASYPRIAVNATSANSWN